LYPTEHNGLSPAVYYLLSTLKIRFRMAFAFEKLSVYQKAVDLADRVAA
jgi:hypothetical protein